jgi:hypothetical protein
MPFPVIPEVIRDVGEKYFSIGTPFTGRFFLVNGCTYLLIGRLRNDIIAESSSSGNIG